MNRSIPLWFFLLCMLLSALFTIAFGWSIKSTLIGNKRAGRLGDVALEIASFPSTVRNAFGEIKAEFSDRDENVKIPRPDINLSEFNPIRSRSNINVDGLLMRANRAALAQARGWRILIGAFTIDGAVKNAALALSPELEIVKVWLLTEDEIEGEEPRPSNRKFIHGFDILSDGSVVFSFDGGVSLQRFDQCGSRLWAVGGKFHHAVTLDDREEFVWTLFGTGDAEEIVKVATATGEIVQRSSTIDIIAANPAIDILEIRQWDDNDPNANGKNKPVRWSKQPFHFNDIDPLPAALAHQFGDFAAGDLLLSARSLNLVFVMDPDTLKVKWWRMGAVKRQHDPDWVHTGRISIYDNRANRDYSQIVTIEPKSYRLEVVFDGRMNDFYSRIRGKHQLTEAGNLIVTSTQQGRVFEVNPDGAIVLEIFNTKAKSEEYNYTVSQAIWRPFNSLNLEEEIGCKN